MIAILTLLRNLIKALLYYLSNNRIARATRVYAVFVVELGHPIDLNTNHGEDPGSQLVHRCSQQRKGQTYRSELHKDILLGEHAIHYLIVAGPAYAFMIIGVLNALGPITYVLPRSATVPPGGVPAIPALKV